jgi:DNA modification methylase
VSSIKTRQTNLATQLHRGSSEILPADCTTLFRNLIQRYQRQQRPITVNFRRMLPPLNAADRFTHLIHPYPAKMLMHIPYLFLANDLLSKPGDFVLDPFCGSGTVLLEAQLTNRHALGADANPLARLIAQVKTKSVKGSTLERWVNAVLQEVRSEPSGSYPDVVNLKHWFYPSVARQLQCLQEAIERTKVSETVRDFLSVCFSVCVRKVSLADPRLSVPVRLRVGQYPQDHPFREKYDLHLRRLRRVQVSKVFRRIAMANISRLEKLRAALDCGSVEVICSDARNLVYEYSKEPKRGKILSDKSVQLIITSPPYPGAQKYIRSSSLSLGWLRLCQASDLRAYKALAIGREELNKAEWIQAPITNIAKADRVLGAIYKRDPIRATIAATYLNEMKVAMQEMYRVLKADGHIVLVAANNRISGREFRTVDYLRSIARECGLSLTACFIDAIRSRGLMTKRNHTADMITREWVLVFTKGDTPKWSR